MKSLWIGLLLVMLVPNLLVFKGEHAQNSGVRALMELAPVDPRSLMQGDYMRLRYALSQEPPPVQVSLDSDGVLRADPKGDLKVSTFQPDTFMFPEGQAGHFAEARYAIVQLHPDGTFSLAGLADEQRNRL